MNKFDVNDLTNCFKMSVDLKGIKKLEEYIKKLEQENNQLKEQYCERTDCGGRLGNSKKVEKVIQENQQLHNKIDKAIEYINEYPLIHYSSTEKIDGKRLSGKLVPVDELLEILKGDVDE